MKVPNRNKKTSPLNKKTSPFSLTLAMCYGQQRSFSTDENLTPSRTVRLVTESAVVVQNLRGRLAKTEALLARARAREAELSRRLDEMKRFVSVMEILETYLKRRFREQQDDVARLFSPTQHS